MTEQITLKWAVDPNHSAIQFKVKHLAVSYVAGVFRKFSGSVASEKDDFDGAKVQCTIAADSLDSNNEQRDKDLKLPDFLNTQQFPEIRFEGLLKKKHENYELSGEVTIRDITRSLSMEAEFTGTGKGRFNDTRVGFEATGKINRKDFGINFSMLTEAGGLIIGEEIRLHFDIQLIKQA